MPEWVRDVRRRGPVGSQPFREEAMRRTWGCIGMLVCLLTALSGCEPTLRQKPRPPKQPEAYNLPPADDARFQQPLAYPKGTLNQDPVKKAKDKDQPMQPPPGGMGGMGGAGRMGAGPGM